MFNCIHGVYFLRPVFSGQNGQLIKVGSNGWSSTNVAILVFFSVYMT